MIQYLADIQVSTKHGNSLLVTIGDQALVRTFVNMSKDVSNARPLELIVTNQLDHYTYMQLHPNLGKKLV